MSLITKLIKSAEVAGVAPHLSFVDDEAGRNTRVKMIGIAKNWLEEQ
jgi:hypothetical protein